MDCGEESVKGQSLYEQQVRKVEEDTVAFQYSRHTESNVTKCVTAVRFIKTLLSVLTDTLY
jgi:hypothetical protein